MSLWGYKKKTKPALWTQTPAEKRKRELASLSKGLRRVKPSRKPTPKAKDSPEKRLYRAEAREFVRAAIEAGGRCPVVAAVKELRDGRKYGHPISDKLNEVHHMRGRLGTLLRDQRFWIALSKQGHRWVHEHPAEARRLGFLCQPGEWNVPVPEAAP